MNIIFTALLSFFILLTLLDWDNNSLNENFKSLAIWVSLILTSFIIL